MKDRVKEQLDILLQRYPNCKSLESNIVNAFNILKECLQNGGTIFCCGNGGSACDSEHIVGELVKSFKKFRKIDDETYKYLSQFGQDGEFLQSKLEGSLRAISLISQTGIISAFANDKSWDVAYAQQLYGLSKKGDCLISLSTSGNSKNCVLATMVAKAKGVKSLSFTGFGGGRLKELSDECICVEENETYKVQELHLPIYHCLCAMLEEEFF